MARITIIDPTQGTIAAAIPNNGDTARLSEVLATVNGRYNQATNFFRMNQDGTQTPITRDTFVREGDTVTVVHGAKAGV